MPYVAAPNPGPLLASCLRSGAAARGGTTPGDTVRDDDVVAVEGSPSEGDSALAVGAGEPWSGGTEADGPVGSDVGSVTAGSWGVGRSAARQPSAGTTRPAAGSSPAFGTKLLPLKVVVIRLRS